MPNHKNWNSPRYWLWDTLKICEGFDEDTLDFSMLAQFGSDLVNLIHKWANMKCMYPYEYKYASKKLKDILHDSQRANFHMLFLQLQKLTSWLCSATSQAFTETICIIVAIDSMAMDSTVGTIKIFGWNQGKRDNCMHQNTKLKSKLSLSEIKIHSSFTPG